MFENLRESVDLHLFVGFANEESMHQALRQTVQSSTKRACLFGAITHPSKVDLCPVHTGIYVFVGLSWGRQRCIDQQALTDLYWVYQGQVQPRLNSPAHQYFTRRAPCLHKIVARPRERMLTTKVITNKLEVHSQVLLKRHPRSPLPRRCKTQLHLQVMSSLRRRQVPGQHII